MNADGSNVMRLTDNPAFDGFSTWSPDGKQIAFVSDWDTDVPTSAEAIATKQGAVSG